MAFEKSSIITNTSIQEYFHDSVLAAVNNQQVEASEETIFYLVNLLTTFSRSEDLFDYTDEGVELKPLAIMYCEAANDTSHKRIQVLQKLGDTALFISGLFADSLNRKLVDVDYYIAIGGNAYASLAQNMRSYYRNKAAQQLFDELYSKFVDFVDVLGEIRDNTALATQFDLMRLYEIWVRTGSKRAKAQLEALGIAPLNTGAPHYQH